MKTFLIDYVYNGAGSCVVLANTKKEAKEKFYAGKIKNYNDESGDNHKISHVEEVKK